MKFFEKHRSILMVGALVVMCTGAFLLGDAYAQYRTEEVAYAASQESVAAEEEKTGQAAQAGSMEISIRIAEGFLTDMPDKPLLQEYAKNNYGDSSLENIVNDINAGTGAKEAILRVCGKAGIDAACATVKDLTKEQIAEIDQEVYTNSDHPKN